MKTTLYVWFSRGFVGMSLVGLAVISPQIVTAEPVSSQAVDLQPQKPLVAQSESDPGLLDDVQPGRDTRSGASYIGIGGNLGGLGGTAVGDPGLIIYSKVGLTKFFSVRPAVVTNFTDDATILLPATVDFKPIKVGSVDDADILLAPYLGAGMAVTTDGDFGPMVTGGIDVPLNKNFTATAGVNAGFIDDADVGVFVGVGYNFGR